MSQLKIGSRFHRAGNSWGLGCCKLVRTKENLFVELGKQKVNEYLEVLAFYTEEIVQIFLYLHGYTP